MCIRDSDDYQAATRIGIDQVVFCNLHDRESHHDAQPHQQRALSAFVVPVSGLLRIEQTDSGLALSSRRILRGPSVLVTPGLIYILAANVELIADVGGWLPLMVGLALISYASSVGLSFHRAGKVDDKLRSDLAERIRGTRRDGPVAGPGRDE